ncbi:hypothetical protein GGR57DRAFT_502998 [Xylariaceae sp. FL1272]|nr:hypothetical protein GGR57DRAFT_502998 [Xylariaceae sp. FL1272]
MRNSRSHSLSNLGYIRNQHQLPSPSQTHTIIEHNGDVSCDLSTQASQISSAFSVAVESNQQVVGSDITSGSDAAGNCPGAWKPKHLSPSALSLRIISVTVFLVVNQGLVQYSRRNDGLVMPSTKFHYLWTFGPMAILTLIDALWGRLECQAMAASPWTHLSCGESAESTLLLDYMSMARPVAVIKAFRKRDWVVAAAVSCRLLLRVAIVLSTALISLKKVDVDVPTVTTLHSSFVANTTESEGYANTIGTLHYYSMIGLATKNMAYPEGTSANYAFQQIDAPTSIGTKLTATVEGFRSEINCEIATLNTTEIKYGDAHCWSLKTTHCELLISTTPVVGFFGNPNDALPTF